MSDIVLGPMGGAVSMTYSADSRIQEEETAYEKAVVRMEIRHQEKRKPELDWKYWGVALSGKKMMSPSNTKEGRK